MIYRFFIVTLLLFSCTGNEFVGGKSKKNPTKNCFTYPSIIDSLGLKDLYDTARWIIYTRYCDKIYESKTDPSIKRYFGEIELKFSQLVIKKDTIDLIFDFIDNGKEILPSMMIDNKQLATGVGFDKNLRRKLYLISSAMTIAYKNDPESRFENPIQQDVLSFVRANWSKLDECFRELAKHAGIRN